MKPGLIRCLQIGGLCPAARGLTAMRGKKKAGLGKNSPLAGVTTRGAERRKA